MTTASDLIAKRLYDAGCRYAFGIPGGEVLAIMEALDRVGIKVVLARHENCAGFMGEGAHHHDGAPAILVATIGPGLANAANVIANAHQDRVPMIVLTGCVPARERHSYTHQVFDHVRLIEPIAKAAYRVEAGNAALLIDKAVTLASEGRPGPVLLDLPIDVQTMEEEPIHPRRQALQAVVPAAGDGLEQARHWLSQAERPIVIAGVGVLDEVGAEAVATFCRQFRIPLITSYKAKGILPEDDPLALGGAGLSPRVDAHLLPLIAKSDCIVLAGYDPIEMRVGWRDPWPEGARVIDISAVANDHGMHQAALNFVGDVAASLKVLGAGLLSRKNWAAGEAAEVRRKLWAESGADETWGPAAVVDELRRGLPREAVVTTDSGAHRILLSQLFACYRRRGLLQSSALCTMGCAVPLAIGRKLAEPDCPVVATVGDGGLEMFLGELATIRDLNLSLPIIVFVDEQLALIEVKQRRSNLPPLAVDFGATDFPAVAKALGGAGEWCRNRAEFAEALQRALQYPGFTVIAAVIGKRAYDGRL
ncbi:thiamine pyrophosphate-binding protein [Limibacillus sp. MBR-115]|jgi:acetolactate synthase-1/2/3 large subunit|uniref:thiamine pyrophosphate-binding protein n=1 Tax=Limibacillus sp. MBR-115 TaxID=3156465 RepID=UPI003395222E